MKTNQKGFTATSTIVTVLLALVIYFIFTILIPGMEETRGQKQRKDSYDAYIKSRPELTQQQAEVLVTRTWGGCTEDKCSKVTTTIEKQGNDLYIVATYTGLRDDSVTAEQKKALVTYNETNKTWTLGIPVTTHQCHQNRGHQDFSSELCL